MLCGNLAWTGETPAHGVVHPDIVVEVFPAQGQSLKAEFDLFELRLRGVGEQRILAGGETHQPLIGQFQTDAAAFHPTAHRGGFFLNFHDAQYTRPAASRNVLPRADECAPVRRLRIRDWRPARRAAASTWPPRLRASREC